MSNGIMEEKNHPYTGAKGKCPKKKPTDYFLNNFAYGFTNGDEDLLQLMVAKYGPIAVTVGA